MVIIYLLPPYCLNLLQSGVPVEMSVACVVCDEDSFDLV